MGNTISVARARMLNPDLSTYVEVIVYPKHIDVNGCSVYYRTMPVENSSSDTIYKVPYTTAPDNINRICKMWDSTFRESMTLQEFINTTSTADLCCD